MTCCVNPSGEGREEMTGRKVWNTAGHYREPTGRRGSLICGQMWENSGPHMTTAMYENLWGAGVQK